MQGNTSVFQTARFIENRGQWPESVRLAAPLAGGWVWIEDQSIVVQQAAPGSQGECGVALRFRFVGASPCARAVGNETTATTHSWFLGQDPAKWVRGVRTFDSVHVEDLYEGIDLIARIVDGHVKFDLAVDPGVDASVITLRCEGAGGTELSPHGTWNLHTDIGTLAQMPDRAFQITPDGDRHELPCRYVRRDETAFGLEVDGRDPTLALLIDPSLVWATFIGSDGMFEQVGGVARASNGDWVVAGWAGGLSFPVTMGSYQHPGPANYDMYVARFRGPDGSLVFSSLIGGDGWHEEATGIALDALDRPTVGGWTGSTDFPTTPGAFDTYLDNPTFVGVLFRLSAAGDSLEYSTYLEPSVWGSSWIEAVDVTDDGAAVVTGTATAGFPTTPGAYDRTLGGNADAFVTVFEPSGSALRWSTYLGGDLSAEKGWAVKIADNGEVTVGGETGSADFPVTAGALNAGCGGVCGSYDTFIARFNAYGSALVFAARVGGLAHDVPRTLALGRDGSVVVGGFARSLDFPTTPGAYQPFLRQAPPPYVTFEDAYVLHLSADGQTLIGSTYFGSLGPDIIRGVAIDASGLITVAGYGGDVPTTPGAFDETFNAGDDWFVARFDTTLSRLFYSSYIGGLQTDEAYCLAMAPDHRVAIGGKTFFGPGFPVTPGAFQTTYGGGQNDGVLAVMDLLPRGVESIGFSTPSCNGPLVMGVTAMPAAAAASNFAVYCSGAPPNSTGFLLLGSRVLTGVPVHTFGTVRLIDPSARVERRFAQTDANGYAEVPLPGQMAQAGSQFAGQFFFRNTAACSATGRWSSSNALRITVQ